MQTCEHVAKYSSMQQNLILSMDNKQEQEQAQQTSTRLRFLDLGNPALNLKMLVGIVPNPLRGAPAKSNDFVGRGRAAE